MSLELELGRVLALLGAKESGKTTLLKILANLEEPSPSNASTGLNGQPVTLYPQSNGSFFSWLLGKSEVLNTTTQIQNILDNAKSVLLLDDPLCDVSANDLESLCLTIRKTAEEKIAIVYATSDFTTAALVADKIVVLDKGTILQTGSPEEIYDLPQTSHIAHLSGRCNIIEARRLTSSTTEIPEFQTIKGGHRLFTEKANVAKLGPINRNVPLAIRPENVVISFGASFPEDNLLKATVIGTKFLGPTTIVELDSNGLVLEAMVFRVVGLGIGDECMLGLPPDRIRILQE
ncbi:MAG TPA: TOBE domain-containing protein [Pyrinomonadaceae bacterium]|nr:TOBE domain-containing protein [Pyrinomonadaceae bacterium]